MSGYPVVVPVPKKMTTGYETDSSPNRGVQRSISLPLTMASGGSRRPLHSSWIHQAIEKPIGAKLVEETGLDQLSLLLVFCLTSCLARAHSQRVVHVPADSIQNWAARQASVLAEARSLAEVCPDGRA
jgi:hypothetical protein